MNSFYSEEELKEIGFASIGENVLISKKTSIYGASKMVIGNNVRIDDFCVLSGKIEIGNYIHIAVFCGLFGGNAGIVMKDFSGLSSRNTIYAASDDYSGEFLTNPTVPDEYKNVKEAEVLLNKHVIIGSGSCVLPGVVLGEGVSVAAMSLVNKNLEEWGIYGGIPCRYIKDRKKELIVLENKLLNKE